MRDELKPRRPQSSEIEPAATRATVPIWIILFSLLLLFLGAVSADEIKAARAAISGKPQSPAGTPK